MNPTVSIILPTYNRSHIIKSAIDSVLVQTYEDFELIIADDCSTDNTQEVIDSYSDNRIHYIKAEKNSGAASARNMGATIARGTYLAFQDSDTIWEKTKLKKQIDFLEHHPDISLVFHPFISIQGDQKMLEPNQARLDNLSTHIFYNLLEGPLIGPPTMLMYTNIFRKTNGFLESLISHEDYEYSLRIAKDYEIGCLTEPLLYSLHPDAGINYNYHEILRTNFYILKKYQSIIASCAKLEATQAERLFYYALLGNDAQYFFDEFADYVLATGHRKIYDDYIHLYNHLLEKT